MTSDRTTWFRVSIRPVAVCLATAALCGACAKAQAKAPTKSVPDGPPLAVPAPPARVLAPVDEPAVADAGAAIDTPPDPTPIAAPPRTAPRLPQRRAEPERPAETAPAAAEGPAEPRDLRPTSPALDAAAEREVRDTLARAARDLARVDYGRLTADARSQYDQSKRFTQQAEQALRDRNVVFAVTLADKAATLAAGLTGR